MSIKFYISRMTDFEKKYYMYSSLFKFNKEKKNQNQNIFGAFLIFNEIL